MKKTLITAAICGLILAAIAGCAKHNTSIELIPENSTIATNGSSEIQLNDDIFVESDIATESVPNEQTCPETQLPTEKEKNQPESFSPPEEQSEASQPAETIPIQINPPKEEMPVPAEPLQPPKPEKPKPTEPAKPSQPVPTEPPVTEAPKPEKPKPTEPAKPSQLVPTEPPVTEAPKPDQSKPLEPQKPIYTQADYDYIIQAATTYAEGYRSKGFTFEWKESMEFGWEVGYMGTPRIERDGLEGTIRMLKYHIDKIVETSTNSAYGLTSDMMTYKVVQIIIDGDIAFAVIYGG